MFKGHPKALFVMFMANMGERFGFYTMVSIFVLFMQAKYGMSAPAAGFMYSTFMVGVYIFPLLGGFLADRFLGYGRTISLGIIVMFIGYVLLAIPTAMNTGLPLVIAALAVVALGTGLFKGNLQALVGNLYDDPKYSAAARPGLQRLLHGHQHRGHVRPLRLDGHLQLDHGPVRPGLRCPHPGPGQRSPRGQARGCFRVPVRRPGPGPVGDPGNPQGLLREVHQRPQQVLSLRLRRRLHQPGHLHAGLLGLPEALPARRLQ